MQDVKISSINRVTLVGKVIGKINFGKASNGREFCRIQLQTEKHVIVKKEPKVIATTHNVVISNKLIVPAFKEHLAPGFYIEVNGELAEENGKCVVNVGDYGGTASFMYIPAAGNNETETTPSENKKSNVDFKKLAGKSKNQNNSDDQSDYSSSESANNKSESISDDDIPF